MCYNYSMDSLTEYFKKIGWWWFMIASPIIGWLTNASPIKTFLEQNNINVNIPLWVWIVIAILIFIVANIFAYHSIRSDRDHAIKHCKEIIGKSEKIHQFLFNLKLSKVVWGLWITGTIPLSEKAVDYKQVSRILVMNPNSKDFPRVAKECGKDIDLAQTEVNTITRNAIISECIQVRWYSQYTARSMTIFDPSPIRKIKGEWIPDSRNAYIVLASVLPGASASDRTVETIERQDSRFDGLFKEYLTTWENSKPQKAQNYAKTKTN
jgi:hypothetical protein